jgi:hypothetical protein
MSRQDAKSSRPNFVRREFRAATTMASSFESLATAAGTAAGTSDHSIAKRERAAAL